MKRCIALFCIMIVTISFNGCTGKIATNSNQDQLKKELADLKKENEKLKTDQKSDTTPKFEPADTKSDTIPKDDLEVIELNKAVNILDFCEFTLIKIELTDIVKPPKANGFHTYYEIKDKNNIYIHVVCKIKNLQAKSFDSGKFADIDVKYNNKYEYTSFSTIEKSGGSDFTYTNITDIDPLITETLHFIAEVPKEVQSSNLPIDLTVKINDKKFNCKFR